MDLTSFIVICVVFASLAIISIFVWLTVSSLERKGADAAERRHKKALLDSLDSEAHREFETIVAKNAEHIKKDVHQTTKVLSDYLEKEIAHNIADELSQYKLSTQELYKVSSQAVTELQSELHDRQTKMFEQLASQHADLSKTVDDQVKKETERRLSALEANIAQVVKSYVVTALANRTDTSSEAEYVIAELEANKKSILEDIKNGNV